MTESIYSTKNDSARRRTVSAATRYRTIVVDPPWPYPGGVSAGGTAGQPVKHFDLPYPAMSLDEIRALPITDLADADAWLFLWATNRYLPVALGLIDDWGFRYRQALVWRKLGASPFGGTFGHNAAEYLLGCSRGDPELSGRWGGGTVIETGRTGAGKHSRKPEVFLDLVETVAPGPYLELFARRNRLGWDTWGNESLEHVTVTT
ncbi:MAG: MT-A70 family methyltransferase [Actinomycetota bacterium]